MKWGRFGAAFAMVLTMVVGFGTPAFAKTPPPDGVGWPGFCQVTGTIQFKPALTNAGNVPVEIKVKLKSVKDTFCANAAGTGHNVGSLQFSGLTHAQFNSCISLLPGGQIGQQTGISMTDTVKWKMRKGTLPTKISNSQILASKLITSWQPHSGSTVMHLGFDFGINNTSSVIAGSFAGHTAEVFLESDQDLNEANAACAGKGLKKLSFGSKVSKDDGAMGSGFFDIG